MVASAKDKKPVQATKPGNGSATIFKLMVAALPLYPAVRINLDAAQGQGETWAIVAIGFVVFGAICVRHAVHSLRERQVASLALWGFLGLAFLALNVLNALGNAASHSDHSRDQNRARMVAAADLTSQKSQLQKARTEQAKVAGETTPESIEAEIRATKAANSKLWSASFSCDPTWITRDTTRAFCSGLAELEAKKAAATKRDEIDAKLAKLDEKAETKGEAPSSVDSFADAMADGLSAFGYEVDEKGKLAIVRARDWGKAIGVELLAGFGPTALLLLFAPAGSHSRNTEEPKPSLKSQAVVRSKAEQAPVKPIALSAVPEVTEATIATISAQNDPLHSFIARRLDRFEGEMVAAGKVWQLWQADCEAHGIPAGTQQAFGRSLKKWFAHDKNNGRPRYLNVRIKAEHAPAPLRLAVNNA